VAFRLTSIVGYERLQTLNSPGTTLVVSSSEFVYRRSHTNSLVRQESTRIQWKVVRVSAFTSISRNMIPI
jgi:hypothetical protein